MSVRTFPVQVSIEHDDDAATSTVVALVGETRIAVESVDLRPEHNNPVDAIRIVTSWRARSDLGYDLVPAAEADQ